MSAADDKVQTDSENEKHGDVFLDSHVFKKPNYQSDEQDKMEVSEPTNEPTPVSLKTHKDATRYSMNHKKRGKALIFNFKRIDSAGLEIRSGSENDVQRLYETLSRLRFNAEICPEMTYNALMEKLDKVSLDNHNDNDCLVIVFMSHGSNEELWATDRKFMTKMLWEGFTADRCPSLAGKPKLFFIQACRGNRMEKGTMMMDSAGINENRETYAIPNQSDFLMAYATIEGRQAARNKVTGAWFIQALCDELLENGSRSSLLTLLTNVNRKVAIDCNYVPDKSKPTEILKQQPVVVSTLNREVYFT